MNILVVGSGGREHALAWKLAEPETVAQVFVAPAKLFMFDETRYRQLREDGFVFDI